jgi:succinoglycan biosynthesis transport protein ExoP
MRFRPSEMPDMPSKLADDNDTNGSDQAGALGFGTFVRGLRRFPLMAFGFLLLAGAAGAAVWIFLPLPKWTAYSVFQVSAQGNSLFVPVGDAKLDFNYYRQAQAALIKSRLVLNAAIKEPEVAGLPMLQGHVDQIAWLENKLIVDFRLGTEFMRLSLEGDNSDEIHSIIAAVTTAYMKDVVNKDRAKKRLRLQQLETLHLKYEESLRTNRSKIRGLAEAFGSGEPTALAVKEKFLQEQIGTAQKDLLKVQSELRMAQVEAKTFEARAVPEKEPPVPEDVVRDAVRSDPAYQKLLERRMFLQASIKELKASLAEGVRHPRLVEKEKELAALQQEMDGFTAKAKPEVAARLQENASRDERRRLAALQERVGLLRDLEKQLVTDVDALASKVKTMNVGQVDLESFKQEIAQTDKMADRVVLEMEGIKPELEAPARVSTWEEPTVVPGIEGNRRLKYSLLAAGLVLVLGLGLTTWREARNRRVIDTKEVSGGLGLRVLGTVPALPRGSARGAAFDGMPEWQHMLTESVDTTRTILLHGLDAPKPSRTILVTSALPGEGKTSLAGHLAISLARAGYRTLLIDGDLRRPALHRVLNAAPTPGLCELLRGEADAAAAVRIAGVEGLSLVPAGLWDLRVPPALSGDRWRMLRERFEAAFDFIIVDSSPLLAVTDGLLMARHTDGVVLSVLWNVSELSALDEARERLESVGVNVLGVVVSGVCGAAYRSRYTGYTPYPMTAAHAPVGGGAA